MALEIMYLNETFAIRGVLDKTNVEKFQSHFKDFFNSSSQLEINVDELEHMDQVGVLAFENLYKESLLKHKRFYITGFGSRDIFEHLKAINAA